MQNLQKTKNKPVVLAGQLSLVHGKNDIHDPARLDERAQGFTKEEREGFTKFLDSGFIDTYRTLYPDKREFSYWIALTRARERNKGQRRDYFVVSKDLQPAVIDSRILTE